MLQIVKKRSDRIKLQSALIRTLKAEMTRAGTRTIGFPSDNFSLPVITNGEGRLWAAFSKSENRPNKSYFNPFGLFEGERPSLNITVEINVGYEETASVAGMIATDDASGKNYFLHSGRIAGGYPGVGMKAFLARSTWARSRLTKLHDGQRPVGEGILIGAIEPGLSEKIEEYVREVAYFKNWVRTLNGDLSSIADEIDAIGRYKREFAGERRRKAIPAVDVVVEHGDIVHALKIGRDMIATKSERVFSTPIIDLYVQKNGKRTEVYEAKTSTDRQALYTALGHIMVHGLAADVPRLILVVPEGSIADDITLAITSMNIELVRYSNAGRKYVFAPPLTRA